MHAVLHGCLLALIRHLPLKAQLSANGLSMEMCLFHPHGTVGPVEQFMLQKDSAGLYKIRQGNYRFPHSALCSLKGQSW